MQPLYFGPNRRLFGIYHPPPAGSARSAAGVVLCHPIGHEYLRAHRAYRVLAQQLARRGSPVLRFDYAGSGDSAGDGFETRLTDWVADVAAAIDELKHQSGVPGVSLVGMRLGAVLGAMAARDRRDVRAVVMWDPIVSGSDYLAELTRLDAAWRVGRGDGEDAADGGCLVGFPLPDGMRTDLQRVDLTAVDPTRIGRVMVITSDSRNVDARWTDAISKAYGSAACSIVPPGFDWASPDAIHTPLSSQAALQAIATAIVAA
jgi:pimeloyl-ACP methyl ester carboxylesterase